ncbi:peptidoglycan-binding domain-containing protein [Allorhizobium pseudoryzae]|uniref:peptidoglycan-binding domain-containing protein n=1 Tax=Allorhizobium pseudoryzae TaxID=379684 RepID=UPI003D048087
MRATGLTQAIGRIAPKAVTVQVPAAPTAPAQKVLPGNSNRFSEIVIMVQTGLKAYGYFDGAITGVVDAPTKLALQSMQQANNLKVTGTISSETLSELGIAAN